MRQKREIVHVATWVISAILMSTLAITADADTGRNLTLRSGAFANGARIPIEYTCSGDDKSPALEWSGAPNGARTMALIVTDPDAPSGTFVHWVVYNVPAAKSGLPENVTKALEIAGGGEQGVNGAGNVGYHGPCPPPGEPHHYHFRLYAADTKLNLKPGATAEQVENALKGHVLASTDLVGMFGR